MVNKEKSEYTLDLDRPRVFKLDFNAFCAAESEVGHPVVRQELGMLEVRALLWAGLRHEDKTLTVEKVGAMIAGDKLTEIMNIVAKGVGDFFAVGEEEGTGATPTG